MSEEAVKVPTKIILHKLSRTVELEYATGECFIIPFSRLRASSTSAEMRADTNKTPAHYEQVTILTIEPVGNYAIKPIFSDGHRTGIYSWTTLYDLGRTEHGSGRT